MNRILSPLALALVLACGFAASGSLHAEEDVPLSKSGKPLTAQQLRMRNCNADAREQGLKGDDRKAFMSTCLRGTHTSSVAAAETAPEPPAPADEGATTDE